VRLAPISRQDAEAMVRGLRSFPLLTGYRGSPPRDVGALEEILLRISNLAEDIPEIAELDCNPVVVLDHGAVVIDARIRVAPAEPHRPLGAR
jgi:acetate---CoA ligase (ADP-forming)